MFLNELSPLYRTMYKVLTDEATEAEAKKGIHKYKTFDVYPAFPWKHDPEVDHTGEDPGVFFRACENAGMVRHVRKEDDRSGGLTMTYSQWLEKHKDEPGFVNNLEGKGLNNEL